MRHENPDAAEPPERVGDGAPARRGRVSLYPLVYTVLAAFKTRTEFSSNRLGLPRQPTLENLSAAFDRLDVGRLLLNSLRRRRAAW